MRIFVNAINHENKVILMNSIKAIWIFFTTGGFVFCPPSQLPVDAEYKATAEIVAHKSDKQPYKCNIDSPLQAGDTININGHGWCVIDSINYFYP